jgi:adenylate cyclase
LDDSNADALAIVSAVDWNQRRFDQAVADAERAVTINPNYAGGYAALSDALETVGKPEEALLAAEQAIRLDPSRPDLYAVQLANAYGHLGRLQEAMAVLRGYLATHPNSLVCHLGMVLNYVELGRDQDARAEAAEVMRISPHFALLPPEKGWSKDAAENERWYRAFRKAGLK